MIFKGCLHWWAIFPNISPIAASFVCSAIRFSFLFKSSISTIVTILNIWLFKLVSLIFIIALNSLPSSLVKLVSKGSFSLKISLFLLFIKSSKLLFINSYFICLLNSSMAILLQSTTLLSLKIIIASIVVSKISLNSSFFSLKFFFAISSL